LSKVPDIPSRTLKNDAETIVQIVSDALELDESSWPTRLDPPLAQSEGPLMKALKNYVRGYAEQVQLPPEVLIRKKDYEYLVRSGMHGGEYHLPARLLGWRFALIGEGLLRVVTQAQSQQTEIL
jgi:ribonuclease D